MFPVAFVGAAPPSPLIVYAARYYYADKRRSHYHIYTSRLDGSHRRQLTFGTAESFAPQWLGRSQVAYVEGRERADDSGRLVVLNVRTGRKRVVGHGLYTYGGYWTSIPIKPRGTGVFRATDGWWTGTVRGWKKTSGRPKWYNEWLDQRSFELPYADGSAQFSLFGRTWTIQAAPATESGTSSIADAHKRLLIPAPRLRMFFWKPGSTHQLWILTDSDEGKYLKWGVQKVDWANGKAVEVVPMVGDPEWQPGSRWWVSSSQAGYVGLGPLTVWGSPAYAGDIRTGRKWQYTTGVVSVIGAEVQPEK